MAGGLRLGSLYVSLVAQTGAFKKGMVNAMKDLEKFARQAKAVSSEVAMVSGVMAAMGGAALAMASKVDGPTKKAMTGLEKSTQLLAVQVADMLLPAVREMSAMFRTAAGVVAGLDPEVKKQISTFAVLAVQVAAAAKIFSLLWGAVAAGAAIMKGVTFAAFSSTILTIGLAVASVIAVVVLLHRAWRKNWGGIQELTADVLNWLKDGFSQFASFMGKVWDFLVDGAASFVDGLLNVIDVVQEVTGKKLVDTGGLREGFAGLWKDLKSGSFFSEAFAFGKSVGQQVAEGLAEEFAAIKKELGFDKSMKGKTIGLGRGMGPAKRDPSGHEFAAMESMRGAALLAAGTLRDMSAEAARFKNELDEVDFAQGVRKWLRDLNRAATTSMSGDGLAEVSLSDRNVTGGRFGGAMRPTTAAIRKDIGASGAQDAANEAAKAMSDAVGAANWGDATAALDAGLGKAADFGQTLELWGKRMAGILGSAGKQLLGAVGDLVDSVVKGAEAGGVWGAIIAAFMEIAKKTASAMQFLDVAMAFVAKLAEMVEPLVKPIFDALTGLLGGILSMIGPLFVALQPLFDAIADLLENLGPILSAIGYLLEAVAPIIEVIGKVVGLIVELLKPIFEIVGGVIKVIATVILGIIIALNEIAAAFGDEAAKAESAKLKGIVDRMWAPGANELDAANREAATATLRNAAAQDEAADAAKRVAESLTNVPAGYRLANARYQADLGISSGNGYTPESGAGGVTINGDVNINSEAETLEDLAEEARQAAKDRIRDRAQRTGNPSRGRGGLD